MTLMSEPLGDMFRFEIFVVLESARELKFGDFVNTF